MPKFPDYCKKKEEKIDYLWNYMNGLILSEKMRQGLDTNAFQTIQLWGYDNKISSSRKQMLKAIGDWHTKEWSIYFELKTSLSNDQIISLPNSLFAECPYSFQDLLLA